MILSILLSSCSTDAPENRRLAAVAETNPKADSIVGLWHRNASEMGTHYRQSVVFQKDGTGMESYFDSDAIWGSQEHLVRFNWTYQNDGTWKTTAPASFLYSGWIWRMAEGKILRNSGAPWYHSQVFERVQE